MLLQVAVKPCVNPRSNMDLVSDFVYRFSMVFPIRKEQVVKQDSFLRHDLKVEINPLALSDGALS